MEATFYQIHTDDEYFYLSKVSSMSSQDMSVNTFYIVNFYYISIILRGRIHIDLDIYFVKLKQTCLQTYTYKYSHIFDQ